MLKIFDVYDIKARLSVVIILMSPILMALYLQEKSIRNLSSTVIIVVVLLAISNLFMIVIRHRGQKSYRKRDLVIDHLCPNDNRIDKATKFRLYAFLGKVDNAFLILSEQKDQQEPSTEFLAACESAVNWLKENSRESDIVNKENEMYGFCRNLLAIKPYGIAISIMMIMVHGFQFYMKFNLVFSTMTPEYMLSFLTTIIYFFVWVLVVRLELLKLSANSYAEALICSFDRVRSN